MSLWTPPTGVGLLKMRQRKRVVTLPTGERVQVTVEDSETVAHTEHMDGRIDAFVRPKTQVIRVRKEG